jgi:hypothetical protein
MRRCKGELAWPIIDPNVNPGNLQTGGLMTGDRPVRISPKPATCRSRHR